ncbi:hypothetical protein [Muricoccus radiodurans]|uniref:hypothetical protein n=1 Tax=Muricoccus radiodurans TaxID=2231721 RepID=UPI003CF62C5A
MRIPLILLPATVLLALGSCADGNSEADAARSGVEPLTRCDAPLGTLAVDDGRQADWWRPYAQRTEVTSIDPVLRWMVQRSNCFTITAMGDGRPGGPRRGAPPRRSSAGRDRRPTTDYFLEPAIHLSAPGLAAGDWSGAGLRPSDSAGPPSATATFVLFDVRSGLQVAAPEASSPDVRPPALQASLDGAPAGLLDEHLRSPAGRAAVAAFISAFNRLAASVRTLRETRPRPGVGSSR